MARHKRDETLGLVALHVYRPFVVHAFGQDLRYDRSGMIFDDCGVLVLAVADRVVLLFFQRDHPQGGVVKGSKLISRQGRSY